MAVYESNQILVQDQLRQLARDIDNAAHGTKTAIKKAFAQRYGWSMQKLHSMLHSVGWDSGRKRRCDAGTTKQDEQVLLELSAALQAGVRKNGKATMKIPNARSMLAANGRDIKVGNARLAKLLKDRKLDLATQKQATPHVQMRSLHPNHVHQVDPSLCLLYYTPNGQQKVLRDDEVYKNKPEWVEKVGNLKCWRYVLTDHYSGSIIVRYYQAKGETQENLYDFLLYCWSKKNNVIFHGVSKLLIWDKGSANTAQGIKNALKALGVEQIPHKAHHARAKGQVEKANDIVETLFESRLKYEPVANIDELNAAVEAWYNAYNSNSIPEYDSRLKRRYMRQPQERYGLWQMIREEQLRLLPPLEVCQWLLTSDPVIRKVAPDLTVSFKHPNTKQREIYDVSHIEACYPRLEVSIEPLIYGGNQILVTIEDYKGDSESFACSPVDADAFSGYRNDAPVFGEEFNRQPHTEVEKAKKVTDKVAYGDKTQEEIDKAKEKNAMPFGGLDAHSHLKDVQQPDYMKRRGTELNVPDRVSFEEKPLSKIQASKAMTLRGIDMTKENYALLNKWYPDGVLETELDELAERLQSSSQETTGLRLVN